MRGAFWTAAHDAALMKYIAGGHLSFARIAAELNSEFNTSFSRNACIGRAMRMGATNPNRKKIAAVPRRPRTPRVLEPKLEVARIGVGCDAPLFGATTNAVKLRCVEIVPRHLSLLDLGPNDCCYPYGGDNEGEAITFCGHPKMPGDRSGMPYCVPHFHLCRGLGTISERRATKGIAA